MAQEVGMSVDLSDYVATLRREVTPPGSTLFAAVPDDTFTGYLADSFWEARLDGFLAGYTCDEDGVVEPTATGGADFPRAEVALVVLYAGVRVLRNKILNTSTSFRAKAGPVEFEQQNGATVLTEMLRQLRDQKNRIITLSQDQTLVEIFDALSIRSYSQLSYYGGIELT
jgi:hypothetical protein